MEEQIKKDEEKEEKINIKSLEFQNRLCFFTVV